MRAVAVTEYGDSEVLETVDRDVPDPGPGEVRVAVRAAGINFADIMQRRGHYQGGPRPPYVPGLEVAGVVDAVGEGVGRDVGDEVMGFAETGGYAEYALANAAGLFDLPEGMSFAEGAGFPVQFLTAHNCLFEWGGLESDESVLIHAAAGGVGTAAVQLADAAGAIVFGTASTPEKLELAADLGCDHPIQYTAADFVEQVRDRTEDGVDLVLDGIGGETTTASLKALSHFGRMVSFGAASGEPGRPNTSDLLFNNHTVIGYHLGQAMARDPTRVLQAVPKLTERLESGALSVIVGREFDLEEAATAQQFIEDRESTGKVVLRP
ncbi:NADPH:quinone reductase or related Zn-dependent oxidoreductase [Halanaeroarchaeum sp. HSR-CO]|uniref:quinone oxidoreductase family protein n=1 Tax=Halanaeroarchaeum sp. HSR-CO TaxID=2866382 RepID=UPI00217E6C91|nr:NADPH:quinone oxidoreductase family protein [Halanaeroarchaeum sp. HSR-CO]UWG48317.1 NADPH:quinone reductase or related Zn-dependent oxidoreductase [Halanaeroarchaeum sp. HSR-CO]